MNSISGIQSSGYDITALQPQSGYAVPAALVPNGDAMPAVSDTEAGYEHTEDSHENDLFSHNRSTALKAYLGFGRSGDTSSNQSSDSAISGEDPEAASPVNDPTVKRGADGEKLDEAEAQEVEELEDRDAEVKAHERAHQSAGGQYAGAPQYEYERGPDGKDYATEGHVDVDVSEESTPQKTLEKMQRVIAAAKAPAEPSSQDLKVAAEANQKAAEARAEIASEAVGDGTEKDGDNTNAADATSAGSAQSQAADDDAENGDEVPGTFENHSGDSSALSDLMGQSLETAIA